MNTVLRYAHIAMLLAVLVLPVRAEVGSCRFDNEYCSCRFRSSRGTCWDRTTGTPSNGLCERRGCQPGWSCSCSERTHICRMKARSITLVDTRLTADTATCHEETISRPEPAELMLGSFIPQFSRNGLLENVCNQVAWWHNGEIMGNYGVDPVITESNVDAELFERMEHTLLELRSGDVLAFRFRDASYYCFNSISQLRINGTEVDAPSAVASTRFARQFSPGWMQQSFVPTLETDEATAAASSFIPLRTNMRVSGEPIVPGADSFQAVNQSNLDHYKGNFYYRIEI